MAGALNGRVAVVTGSGGGLGRAYAMALAREGAKVVINDLGCETDGTGSSHIPADKVTEEINKSGGTAVANYDSVSTSAGADRIIQTAVDKFGRIDILVNNAGITRSKLLFDMTDDDFEMVLRAHLFGAFYCSRAASRFMIKQKYGRIISISSISGFSLLAGELNYSVAKGGIAVFTRTIARDMVKYGVTCNAIVPASESRLGKPFVEERAYVNTRLGEPALENFNKIQVDGVPEDVAPLILYLATEQAKNISGCLLEIHGRYIALYDDQPPHKVRTLVKDQGRFSYEELVKILPQTITRDVKLPEVSPPNTGSKFATDAIGWVWANNKLVQGPAQTVPTTKVVPNV
jgi:NAD(P)-dependent dehydrogenase (short-subunit alcohol dehydrogenase family)